MHRWLVTLNPTFKAYMSTGSGWPHACSTLPCLPAPASMPSLRLLVKSTMSYCCTQVKLSAQMPPTRSPIHTPLVLHRPFYPPPPATQKLRAIYKTFPREGIVGGCCGASPMGLTIPSEMPHSNRQRCLREGMAGSRVTSDCDGMLRAHVCRGRQK
jgi:hypothetical protein